MQRFFLPLLLVVGWFAIPAVQAEEPRSFVLFEGGGGMNACAGDFCRDGGPSWGLDVTAMVRVHPHFGIGFNTHYGMLDPDKLEMMYYYILNFEARGILPLGSRLQLFGSLNFGYVTTYADGLFNVETTGGGNEDKYMIFRATGVTAGVSAGFLVRLTKRLGLGVMGRFWLPNWSDACFYEDRGGQCMEPQDLDIDLDMKPWYAGLFVQYELPR